MPRFGFSKEDEDGNRAGLFSRKKSSSNSTQEANPYAQHAPQGDPYSAPMTSLQKAQASMGLPAGPRGGRPGLPGGGPGGPGPRPAAGGPAPASYGGRGPPPAAGSTPSPQPSGYAAGGYGAASGYGSSKYDGGGGGGSYGAGGASYGGVAARPGGVRRGGYGGMGGSDDGAPDPNRQALFGDAPQKYAAQQQQRPGAGAGAGAGAGMPAGAGGGAGSGFDGYGGAGEAGEAGEARELTEEEQEDADVKRMNAETRYLRNETDQSLDRSLMIANQSIETARATMARMYNQRDRLLNVEGNLDEAANHNKIAEHRAAELKHYNRSMFAVKVNNPFTSKQRAAAQAQAALDEHRAEREQREETRRLAYLSNRTAEDQFNRLDKSVDQGRRLGQPKPGVSSKFNLEDDDEEDLAKEQQIDAKIGLLEGAVGTLNLTARAMNDFATEDLEHIDRIAAKSDNVDDQVRANRYRLERIEKGR